MKSNRVNVGHTEYQKKSRTEQLFSVEYNERQRKTRTGADPKNSRTVKPKMFAVVGSKRDPDRAYDLYAPKQLQRSVGGTTSTKKTYSTF